MFTGIVQATGTIQKVTRIRGGSHIAIKTDQKIARRVSGGESIAIDGVCLTALPHTRTALFFELMDSTLKLTTLSGRNAGDKVNVELSMRGSDLVGGHFLSGHVDGVSRVDEVTARGNTRYYRFAIPAQLMRYLVAQGSIAINGVSLTVVKAGRNWCSVALTPYTRAHTNLGDLKVGDIVNVEVDMLAKYLEKLLKTRKL